LKEKAKREGRPQYEIYVERDFDKFLVALRQIFNNWKKIEEHIRIRGKKTIHSSHQSILDRIKSDTLTFIQILEGALVYQPDEEDVY
jgi:hypothetical protein